MRPMGDHYEPSCITLRCKGKRIEAVVDTGSDVTIVGTNVVKSTDGRFGLPKKALSYHRNKKQLCPFG